MEGVPGEEKADHQRLRRQVPWPQPARQNIGQKGREILMRMKPLRELTVFSHGDSTLLSTWSNVPYFFTRTIESKGIKVNRVNINPPYALEELYDRTVWR